MAITAQQIADSLVAGSVIHDNAVKHQVGLMEQVEEIVKAQGFELRHESDVYTVKGQVKALAAKIAKDAADKAAAEAKALADKAAVAKAAADQAAAAASAAMKAAPPATKAAPSTTSTE